MIDVRIIRIQQVTLMELKGRMDIASRDKLIQTVEDELNQTERYIIIDLSGVTYMSAAGLKVLRHIQEVHGDVRLAMPSPRILELLEITGLSDQYKLFTSSPEAIHTITPVVNAHTHLEFGWMDKHRPAATGSNFFEWLTGVVGPQSRLLGERRPIVSRAAAERGVEALIDAGTTTIGDIATTGESIAALMRSGLRGIVYIEVLGLRPEDIRERMSRARELIDYWRPKARYDMRLGLSLHTPYTVAPELWEEGLAYAEAEDLPLCIHVAESPTEYEFFTQGTGPIRRFQQEYEIPHGSPMMSPVRYLEEIGALAQHPLLVHAVHVDDDDIRRIKANDCKVVHCPRSNLRLQCGRMPLEKFLDAEVPVYLGTDGLGSSPSLNIMDELEFAVALHYGRVPPEAITPLVHQPLL